LKGFIDADSGGGFGGMEVRCCFYGLGFRALMDSRI
jgi:hypothetical protein